MGKHRRNRLPALVPALTSLAVSILLPSVAQAEPRQLSCEYVESGPPGPAGNLLEITGNDDAQVRREGDRVLVGTSAGNGPRDFEAVPCGGEATVTNVDRIVYRGTRASLRGEHQFLLDEREAPLGPGASPEATDPEIEVEVVLPEQPRARPRVQLLAGEASDEILVGGGAARLAVSLEPHPGGEAPDPDLIVAAPPHTVELKLHGGGGGDVLDARPLDRHRGLVRSLFLAGDEGKDALLGTEREDRLQGGAGPDRLFGRGGRDFLYPSAGADLTVGGAGADFISGMRGSDRPDLQPDSYFGGSSDDFIDARRGGVDQISCGEGRDEALADRRDAVRDGRCERLLGPAGRGRRMG
jgi:Ca2+-binding RTX toxin-like protein